MRNLYFILNVCYIGMCIRFISLFVIVLGSLLRSLAVIAFCNLRFSFYTFSCFVLFKLIYEHFIVMFLDFIIRDRRIEGRPPILMSLVFLHKGF